MTDKDDWMKAYDAQWEERIKNPSSSGKSKNWWGKGGAAQGGGVAVPRCHTKHKEIELGGGVILGASCSSPRPGYDIYVGLDAYSMTYKAHRYPWQTDAVEGTPEHEFLFPIIDGSVPPDNDQFGQMVVWLVGQLAEGKRVHIGCIGGHGRTGFLIAAIAATLGNKDAIKWVRKNHCNKAIETESQVAFLVKHYGVKSAEPTKVFASAPGNINFSVGSNLVIGNHRIKAMPNSSLGIW